MNKFEKEKKVIELHKQGKTIRQIAPEVHKNFRDISNIIKAYERKKILETKREENNQYSTIKKLSLSSRAFILFKEGKKIDETKVLLDIPFKLAIRYWKQYLKSIGMFEAFEFYQDHSYDIPTLLSIATFMKRNNISGSDVVNVLRTANDIFNLNQTYSNLKIEIKYLQDKKMNLLYYSNSPYSLRPLPLNRPNYNYYRY